MKIRNGFVSNSSSSSFIMIGANADKLSRDFCEEIENTVLSNGSKIENVYYESRVADELIGIVLADSEYELSDGILDNMAYEEHRKLLAEKLNININEISIYYGTRPS